MKMPSLASMLFEQEEAPIKWESKYESFVSALGNNANDPKTQAFIAAGLDDGDPDDDKFDFSPNQSIPVKSLRPTQQEVDIDKSLSWPLEKEPEAFVAYTTSNGPFTLGDPIVTFNGKYVIDGHHRWSQLYSCNSEAEIVAINISMAGVEPIEVLKALQAAIALKTNAVPAATVEGKNLFDMNAEAIEAWINSNVSEDTITTIANSQKSVDTMTAAVGEEGGDIQEQGVTQDASEETRDVLPKFIWKNVHTLQEKSRPIENAPTRDLMPQTDDVAWEEPLEKGIIDIVEPHGTQQENKTGEEEMILERWRKLAGLNDNSKLLREQPEDERLDVEAEEGVWSGGPNLVIDGESDPEWDGDARKPTPREKEIVKTTVKEPEQLPAAEPVLNKESLGRLQVYRGSNDVGKTCKLPAIVFENYFDAMVTGNAHRAKSTLEEHLDARYPGWMDYEWRG
jgi:hypothetical protein